VTEGGGGPTFVAPSGWSIRGTADFDNDGQTDVVATTGTVNEIWLLKNGAVNAKAALPFFSVPWQILGIADANGDGRKDVIYQLDGGSKLYAVFLNGVQQTGMDFVTNVTVDPVSLSGPDTDTDLVRASVSYGLGSGVENLTLTGSSNIDGTGNALTNTIVGNASDNVLLGKGGADILTGGLGADRFAFDLPTGGTDRITDFVSGVDRIQISAAGFGGGLVAGGGVNVVAAADATSTPQSHFIFDGNAAGSSTLYWDATGGSAADAVAVATLTNVGTLLASDFLLV
jgi:Ca2+-binding RTX toxin-like protein